MADHGRTKLMVISSAALAVAPKCPLCLWTFFGTFGAAAVSGSVYRVWLPPLTVIWLIFTVGTLACRSGGGHRYGPALLGLFGSLAILSGKFVLEYQALVYTGIGALLGAAVWRAWFQSPIPKEICSPCEPQPVPREEPGLETLLDLPTNGGH